MFLKRSHITVIIPLCLMRNFIYVALSYLLFTIAGCNQPKEKGPITEKNGLSDDIQAEQCKQRTSYDSAILYFRKSVDFNFKTSDWIKWGSSVNGIIDCYRAKGELNEAFKTLDLYDSISKNKINTRSQVYASLIHKRAILLSEKGEYEKSNGVFLQTINLRHSLKIVHDTTLALSYNGMGTNFLYLGKYDEASEYYLKAVQNYDSLGITHSADYAMFNQNAGIIYAIKGDFNEARQYFQLSLSINKSILNKNDPKLALVYLNIGRFFSLTGDDEKALELLTQSEEIYKLKDKKSLKLSSLYLNIGAIYVNKANYEKALSYYNKALAIIQSSKTGSQSDLLTVLLNLGFIYEKKGDYSSANSYYLQGLEKGDKFQNSLKVLRGLANINFLLGKNSEAAVYYEQALKKSMEMFGPDHPETALTYFKYGEFSSVTGKDSKALEFMKKGLEIFRKAYGEKNPDVGYAYLVIANYYDRNKEFAKSLPYFQHAIIASFKVFNDPDILKNPLPDKSNLTYNQLNMISGKASALYSMYLKEPEKSEYINASADAYSLSLDLIELLRSTYQEEDSKLLISGNEKNTVLDALRTQVELFKRTNQKAALEKAFTYAEKGKSSVLLSYIRDMEARDIGKIPDNLRKLDNKLKSDISFYNKLLFEESSKKDAIQTKVNLWNTNIFELSRQHDSLISVIEKMYPAYYNLKYDNSVISIGNTSKKLTNSQAMVEYSMADSVLYIFAITRNDYKLYKSTLDRAFFTNLKTVRDMLIGKSFNNYSPEDFHAFTDASYQLYKILLEPAKSLISGKDLIVVPDAELGYLSFDILLTSPPGLNAKGYRNLPYLLKQSPISYAPSATALFEGFKNPAGTQNHKVLAFAPSYENIKGVKVEDLLRGKTYRDYLQPIPGAQVEVKNLKKILSSDIYNGKDATEANFKKNAGNYSILHLAMHTIINNKNPLYSKLVFYHNAGDTVEDGLLNTSELFGMQLNADLAVLSACNTGTGKLERGEGIMSLSRGFFYAGVPSIIMTSWAVEDQSGVSLMSSFYKYLSEGKPKNEALQLAKLDYLESADQLKSHPHFWAAYMNIGDISPVQHLKHPVSQATYIFIFIIAIIAIAGAVFLIRKKHQNIRG